MLQAEFQGARRPGIRAIVRLLAVCVALAVAPLAITGCQESGESGPDTSGGSEGTSTAPSGDPVVVMLPADVVTLDPPRPTDGNSLLVVRHVFDTLVDFEDSAMEPAPGLAESWEVSEDGTRYTFKLRDNATFSDGSAVTAEDVKFTFDRLIDTDHPQHYPGIKWSNDILSTDWFDHIEVQDEKTVAFVLKRPYVPLLLNLAIPASGIISKDYTIKAGDEGTSTKPMGSGPYVLEEWKQGAYLKLKARDDHWRGKPKNPALIFQPQEDPNQTVSAMRRGDAHFAVVVSPIAMGGRDKGLGDAELIEIPLPSLGYVIFNVAKEQLKDKRVRQAMNYAIDRESIAEGLLAGTSIPAHGILPPGMLGWRDTKPYAYSYDLEKAKALMAEAGYGPEKPLKVTFHTFDAIRPYNVAGSRLTQRLQEDLRKIGVEAEIQLMEFGGLIEMLEQRTVHELANIGWMTDNGDPDNFIYYLFGNPTNRANYDNPESRKLMEAAQAEQDPVKREKMYQDAEDIVMQDPPALFINHAVAFKAQSKDLRGFTPHPLVDRFWDVYLEN